MGRQRSKQQCASMSSTMTTTTTKKNKFLLLAGATTLLAAAHTAQAFLFPFQGGKPAVVGSIGKGVATPASPLLNVGMARGLSSLMHAPRAAAGPRARRSVAMMSTKGNNQMSPESYTEKAWDVITRLPQLATRLDSQFIDNEILLKSMLEEGPQALAYRVFFKAGVKVSQLETDLDNYIAAQPKVPDASNKVSLDFVCVNGWVWVRGGDREGRYGCVCVCMWCEEGRGRRMPVLSGADVISSSAALQPQVCGVWWGM
jgi:hypothetical protein